MKYLTFVFALLLSVQAQAANNITVEVNGLVCDFCAQAVEKVFGKDKAVKAIDVNLSERYVKIDLNEGLDITDEKVTKLITDSGYDVVKITRGDLDDK